MSATIPNISEPAPTVTPDHPDYERLNARMFRLHIDYPTTLGEGKFKKVTDPDSGMKVYTGNGCAVHPSKKKRYKINGDTNMIGLERIRPKPYIPPAETRALVVPKEDSIPGQMNVPPDLGYRERMELIDRGILEDYVAGLQARQRIAREHNRQVVAEYRATHRTRTDTPEFAYKRFSFLTASIEGHGRRAEMTHQKFYREFRAELHRIAADAALDCGVEVDALVSYIRDQVPALYKAVFEDKPQAKKSTGAEPETVEDLEKKLDRAIKRRDKAQREIETLELEIKLATGEMGRCSECDFATANTYRERFTCKPCVENSIAMDVPGFTEPESAPQRSLRAERRHRRVERQRAKRARQQARIAA